MCSLKPAACRGDARTVHRARAAGIPCGGSVLQWQGPELGARFAAAVEEATTRAVAFPSTGSLASKNTRRVFIKDFPIALVYRQEEGGILIVALAHHARRPHYGHGRVQEH